MNEAKRNELSGAGEAGANLTELLNVHLADHISFGCINYSKRMGCHKLPDGYALMLNSDRSHFYWLRFDGRESDIHWNKWAVFRGIKVDAEKYI
jgi:hypothetical protein